MVNNRVTHQLPQQICFQRTLVCIRDPLVTPQRVINLAVSQEVIALAHQLNDFINTGHKSATEVISVATRQAITEVAGQNFRPPSSSGHGFLAGAVRTRATSTDPLGQGDEQQTTWPSNWSIDKPALRKAAKQFEKAIRWNSQEESSQSGQQRTSQSPSGSSQPPSGSSTNPDGRPRSSTHITTTSGHTEEIHRPDLHRHQPPGHQPAMTTQPPAGMDPAQWTAIMTAVQAVMATSQLSQPGPAGPAGPQGPPGLPGADGTGTAAEHRPLVVKSPEDIGFFDPAYEDPSGKNASIVNAGRHVYYRDVFIFLDRLRDLSKGPTGDRVKDYISGCLRGEALIWYSTEVSELEKDLLRGASLDQWCIALTRRFKVRSSKALLSFQNEKYTMADARSGKTPRSYIQQVIRHAKNADFASPYHQMLMAWNNLDLEFKMQISEPRVDTSWSSFVDTLDSKASIWQEMADLKSSRQASKARQTNKQQHQRGRQEGPSGPRYTSYQFQNPAYQQYPSNRPSSSRQNFNEKPLPALPAPRKALQITYPNAKASGSKNQNARNQSDPRRTRFQPKDAKYDRKGKGKAYIADADEGDDDHHDDQHIGEESQDLGDYYTANEDMDYYNPDVPSSDYDDEDDEVGVNLVVPIKSQIRCRRCRKRFSSNNKLHCHLRDTCNEVSAYTSTTRATKASSGPSLTPRVARGGPQGDTDSDKPKIIESRVDSSKDVGTGYGFRGYNWGKIKTALQPDMFPEDTCGDTGAGVTLGDDKFMAKHAPDVLIRTMATPLKVRGLGTNRHETSQYGIYDMYHHGKDKDGNPVVSKIRREVHLVKDLKANMLIGNDVLGPEGFVMDLGKGEAYIGSTGVTIPLEVRSAKSSVQRMVHIKQTTVVPPFAEMALQIHHCSLPESRDFLFEPDDVELTMFAHMIDASTHCIIARNEGPRPIHVPRNYRLGRISELDYPNAFQVDATEKVKDMAMRQPKATHQTGWFKKVIGACAAAYAAIATSANVNSSPNGVSSTNINGLSPSTTPLYQPTSAPLPEIVMPNGVTIYQSEATDSFTKIVNDYPALWQDTGFADLPEDNWMKIPLKSDWEQRVTGKAKVYPLGTKDRELVDDTFDELHRTDKMAWTDGSTPFSYPVFCVWKTTENGQRKGRVVVDIRGLNAITQPDAYPLPLQSDMIQLVRRCSYITVIDCSSFFYQWRVHPQDRHKLTVVSHRGQESFNVAVMGYKNSPAYVQRQIDRLLRAQRKFARAYVDDIVIFSETQADHEAHLHEVFSVLQANNISIKAAKAFVGYPSVALLGQRVDSFGLATSAEKLKAIAKLRFPRTLKQLETYLGLTGWLRDYIAHYAGLSKPLQARKTELLRGGPVAGSARRNYSSRTKVKDPTEKELLSFELLQSILSEPSYLVHVDASRQLFIDLDASKEFGIGAMLYYVKEQYLVDGQYPPRHAIEPVLFLSRLINDAESRYWPTELELAGIVWVLRKTRHIVEASSMKTIIYTDHGAALGIARQTSLTTTSTDKLNLRLVRASDYIQRFNLEFRHKPGKQHIVPDALSRLASANDSHNNHDEGELDALFTASLVEMDPEFKKKIIDGYRDDPQWAKTIAVLDNGSGDAAKLPFSRESDGLIFRSDGITTGDHAYQPRRLCIPRSVVSDILALGHNEGHHGFAKCYDFISASWYIRGLSRHLRAYLKHCPQCQVYQTRRHAPYGSMQPILTPPVPFHTITIDFILALPTSTTEGFDTAMSVTCKFTKRVTIIAGKATYTASQWGIVLLERLDVGDWGLPKAIISDRDKKFLSDMWSAMFNKLGVRLLYSTAYHPQTDGQSERTNQTVEIALRFHLAAMTDYREWPKILSTIQRHLNNGRSSTGKSPNEAAYGFTPVQPLDMSRAVNDADVLPAAARARVDVADSIAFAQMNAKFHYDRKHQPLNMRVGDEALIRLHRGYDIPSTAVLGPKLSQQYTGPFKVTERVGRLAYRLDLPSHWRIHPVLSVAQLEPATSDDPFHRPRPDHPDSVFVEGDTATVKSFEIERLINKRQTARRGSEYLVRWKGYGPEYDVWRNLPELGDAMDLVDDYEKSLTATVLLPGYRLSTVNEPRRGPGRPPKAPKKAATVTSKPDEPRRGRGRPRKAPEAELAPTSKALVRFNPSTTITASAPAKTSTAVVRRVLPHSTPAPITPLRRSSRLMITDGKE